MITIIDYGMGNIGSVSNALGFLNIERKVTSSAEDILSTSKLILPGVGSYRAAMENINKLGLLSAMNEAVLDRKIPFLGICLGMQLLSDYGEEHGMTKGIGWIPGNVKQMSFEDPSVKIPHIGFNTTYFENTDDNLFEGLDSYADFYFVHSYSMICEDEIFVTSWTDYGRRIVASVQKENIFGVQFHPEKSQTNGLQVLYNFSQL